MCGRENGSCGVAASGAVAAFVDLNRHADRVETAAGRRAAPANCRPRFFVIVAGKMLMMGVWRFKDTAGRTRQGRTQATAIRKRSGGEEAAIGEISYETWTSMQTVRGGIAV